MATTTYSGMIAYTRRRIARVNATPSVRVFFRSVDGKTGGVIAMDEDAASKIKPNVPYTIQGEQGYFRSVKL